MNRLHPKPRLFHDFILIDGITRAGKFLLAQILQTFEGVELVQYPMLLETLLYFRHLNMIDLDVARALLASDLDLNTYNMIVGRQINTRPHDLSSVYRTPQPDEFLKRSQEQDPEVLLKNFEEQKRLPLYVSHEGLANGQHLFGLVDKVRIFEILRDPICLVESWSKRGFGHRFGTDPKAMAVAFKTAQGPAPWFSLDWKENYFELNEMERVLKSIHYIQTKSRQEYEALTTQQKKSFCFIAYEDLIREPQKALDKMAKVLGKKPLSGQEAILARERLPRAYDPAQKRKAAAELIRSKVDPRFFPLIEEMATEYDSYWLPKTLV